MERKTPAREGRGAETLAGNFRDPFNLSTAQAQWLASRYALPINTAATVAALAFGGAHHG